MKHSIITFFLLLECNVLFAQTPNSDVFTGCATDELMNHNVSLIQLQKTLDTQAYKYFLDKNKIGQRTTSSIEYIPVVVHIIHNGGLENISNTQVQLAISNINAKYLQSNGNQIQFCLAQRDPQGNPTTGITRDQSTFTTETMEVDDTTLKNINRWPPTCYFNIWVIKEILSVSMGSGVIGYSSFPSAYGTNTDGVVIEANYFGNSSTTDAVGAHEIGHYLGLYHTFQNGCVNNNCLQDGDQVCDTPPDQTTFASCNPPSNSCSTDANDPSSNNPFTTDMPDLSDDYMDYSAFTCYNQFTTGQYDRMQYFLTHVRSSLLGCLSCTTPCPNLLSATITTPNSAINISVGASVNFSGSAVNSTSYQWYLTPSAVISTNLTTSYTFNTAGTYWMKFVSVSSNPSLCLNGIDSIQINVIQPIITACQGSLQFVNANDAVHLPANNQIYSSNGFTWESWFKLTTTLGTYEHPLICAVDAVTYEDIWLGLGWNAGIGNVPLTNLAFKVDGPNSSTGPSPNTCNYMPPGGFLVGTWYHAAGTMDYITHTSKLYLNGVLVDTKTVNSAPITRIILSQLSYDVALAPGYPNPPLGGNMDEVRIWNRVRTASEIAASYNQCMNGNEQNLLIYYRCNQSAGSMAQDATANGNDGTLSHTALWSTQQPILNGANCFIGCASSCPPIKSNNDTTICLGGSVQLKATTGFSSYTWTPSAGLSNNNVNSPIASPTITTNYIVTGTSLDTNHQVCTSIDTIEIKVVKRTIPTLNIGNDIVLCSSGTHTFDAGTGFYKYLWNDGSINRTYTVYGTGKYWVTVKDSCGGIQSDTVFVTLGTSPVLNLKPDTTICKGDSVILKYTPIGVYNTYQWSPSLGLNCNYCSNPFAKPLISTMYYLVASTAQGCTALDSIFVSVNTNVPTEININLINPTCELGNGTIKLGNVIGGTAHYMFNLNNSGYSTNTSYINLHADTYNLIVMDSLGCGLKTSITLINNGNEEEISIPNCFTPNGDLINEAWFIKGDCISSINCVIYNRWGEQVASLTKITDAWNGKNKDAFVTEGVYSYIADIIFASGKNVRKFGFISVFK